jgi:hypothetical protein
LCCRQFLKIYTYSCTNSRAEGRLLVYMATVKLATTENPNAATHGRVCGAAL